MTNHLIMNLPIGQLHNHPKNVRQNYTDLDELAISIEAQGVLQNLTVVPEPGHEEEMDSFYVLIGNRRLQAARKTSLETLPCVIALDLTEAEQVTIMINENMQRKDLTPIEEAQGFQYMLDLGETEESISLKTGVSKTTVRRRLELNKLDPALVQKRTSGDSGEEFFQLSLTDLDRLTKIKSVKERNQILKTAKGSENLKFLVNESIQNSTRREYFKNVMKEVKRLGIPEANDQQRSNMYSSNYERVASFSWVDADRNIPIRISDKNKNGWFYYAWGPKDNFSSLTVYAKVTKKEKEANKSKAELEREQKEKNRKAIMKIARGFSQKRTEFYKAIAAGEYTCEKGFDLVSATWMSIFAAGIFTSISMVMNPFDLTSDQIAEMGIGIQMLGCLIEGTSKSDYPVKLDGTYSETNCRTLTNLYGILQKFGFSTDDEDELQLMDGSHPLYASKDPQK